MTNAVVAAPRSQRGHDTSHDIGAFSEIRAVLRDEGSRSARPGNESRPSSNLLLADGEEHRVMRQIVTQAIQRSDPEMTAQLEAEAIRAFMRKHQSGDSLNLVSDLIEPMVLATILPIVTSNRELWPRLAAAARKMMGLLDELASGDDESGSQISSISVSLALAFRRQAATETEGVSSHAAQAAERGLIDPAAAMFLPAILLHGGFENPVNALGAAFMWLRDNLDRIDECKTPAGARAAFVEALIARPPVRQLRRVCEAGIDLGRGSCPRGADMYLHLDEAITVAASAAELSTASIARLTFGDGSHRCPGMGLAMGQGARFLGALADVGGAAVEAMSVDWTSSTYTQGPDVSGWK